MNKGKRKSATVFSRDEIGVEQLQSLKEKFADGDLNEKEFVSLFREIIDASLSETQLTELFQKIDANSDGTVDWDELTNYMFLSGSDNSSEFIGDDCNEYYETYQPEKLGELVLDAGGSGGAGTLSGSGVAGASGSGSAGTLGGGGDGSSIGRSASHHKDLITRVLRLEKPYLYLTASKDGSVRTWNAHTMQLQNVLTTGRNWLTDCCVMRRSNRLAVTSMNRTLGIYDLGSNALIGEISEYSKRQAIPLCVEYVEKPADDREALVIGDDTGGITVMTCSDQWMACDGRSSSSTASAAAAASAGGSSSSSSSASASASGASSATSAGGGTASSSGSGSSGGGGGGAGGGGSSAGGSGLHQTTTTGSASLEAHGFSSRVKFKKHTDWVTRVKWVNDIRAIVATSLDTNISIIDIDRMVVKFEYNRHKKGVFDLVWCSSTRLIASCGMERDISIWNPYSSQRAVATLRGHTSSVVQLVSDDDNYQIISVASDNTFKVWDVRNHRCLQTWVDKYKSTGGAENRISALLFDAKQPCLVSGTTHLTKWPFKATNDDDDGGDDAKEKPMSIASYNGVFHQVVTAEMSAESVVKTWSAETGDEICSFASAHGQSPVTAISFDYPGRRLLTGSHDGGVIKMWNFSNGALVKQFHKQEDSDAAAADHGSSPAAGGGSGAGGAGGGASTSLSLADDLSFLGLEGDDGDGSPGKPSPAKRAGGAGSGGAAAAGASSASSSALRALPTSPRKRNKVRDIMLLPPTFGMDLEGRKNAHTLSEYAELPSPTRTRLHPKGGKDTPRSHATAPLAATAPLSSSTVSPQSPSNQSDGPATTEPAPPVGDAPPAQGRTPRARRSSVSGSTVSSSSAAAAALLESLSASASDKGNKYCEKEVTSILDIERNLRVGMGDYICQRFVCSVGWDRSVYVWADKNDESEALPIHVLPTPKTLASHPAKCHTMDVLALVYIPPAYIATAGLDGAILLWSINSGDFLSRVYQSAGSIDAMFYASKIEMLFASGETGELVCLDRSMAPRAVLPLEHPHHEAVTALRCDRTNSHLVTGDAAGYLKVWDLAIAPDHEGLVLQVCCLWRVPGAAARVLGLDFVEHVRASEPFLLVSSGNGDVSLWTMDGVQVGCFGKHRTWQLGRPATYLASTSSCIWPGGLGAPTAPVAGAAVAGDAGAATAAPALESVSPAVIAATMTRPQFIDCFSIAALNGSETARDSFLLEDSMPKPGEVWVCVSGHRSTRSSTMSAKKAGGGSSDAAPVAGERRGSSGGGGEPAGESRPGSRPSATIPAMFRRASSNSGRASFAHVVGAAVMRETLASLPFLQQRLGEVAGEVTDLITVVKVTRGEISCWDGNGHKPPVLKTLEMSEFVRKAGWIKQPLLTQYIGRMFAVDDTHFQVNAVSLVAADPNKPDRKTFSLIDTRGQDHGVLPLNEAVSVARVKVQAQLEQLRHQPSGEAAANGTGAGGASGARQGGTRKRLTAMPTASALRIERGSSTRTVVEAGSDVATPSPDETAHAPPTAAASAARATLTSSVAPAHVLPLIKTKDHRPMGGLLPKRSSVRMRHDQSVDFRRIHAPEDVPKSFRAALNQRIQATLAASGGAASNNSSNNNNNSNTRTRASLRFDGVLPE